MILFVGTLISNVDSLFNLSTVLSDFLCIAVFHVRVSPAWVAALPEENSAGGGGQI